MPQMTHRLQLLLDDDRYARVADLARRTGAPPMDVPDIDERRREIEAMHDQQADRW